MLRWAAAIVLIGAGAAFAAPAWAEAQPGVERRLEPRWQTEIPADPKGRFTASHARVRVADDGRMSFGLTVIRESSPYDITDAVLVTVAGSGEILSRAAVQGDFSNSAIAPLAGGDFLIQGQAGGERAAIELRRHAPDGQLRFSNLRKLGVEGDNNALRDAVALADGRTLALSETGPGPNAVMVLDVLDAAGRSLASQRLRVMLGSAQYSRLYKVSAGAARERVLVVLNGDGRQTQNPPYETLLRPFVLQGRIVSPAMPITLGREGEMRCNALALDGRAIVGIVPSAATSTIFRWYSAAGKLVATRTFAGGGFCTIAARDDGVSLVILERNRILAFAANGAPLWNATLPLDADAVAWMLGGDIAVIHAADSGVRLVRYALR